jgi:Holliday junction resolvase RusA-like endonuclease
MRWWESRRKVCDDVRKIKEISADVKLCALSFEPEARLIGNNTAAEIAHLACFGVNESIRLNQLQKENAELRKYLFNSRSISFFVPGIALPKGSTKSFVVKGRAVTTSTTKGLKPWQNRIALFAQKAGVKKFVDGAVRVDAEFVFERPKSHYGTGRNADKLKPSAPRRHTSTPDRDKLERALHDGLTGIAYRDDCQVDAGFVSKRWAIDRLEQPGVEVTIQYYDEEVTA